MTGCILPTLLHIPTKLMVRHVCCDVASGVKPGGTPNCYFDSGVDVVVEQVHDQGDALVRTAHTHTQYACGRARGRGICRCTGVSAGTWVGGRVGTRA